MTIAEYHSTFGIHTRNLVDQRAVKIVLRCAGKSNVTVAMDIKVNVQNV